MFQNDIGQRILTALHDYNEYCLPDRLVLCHWAFEAQNDQFVHIIGASLSEPHINGLHFPHYIYGISVTRNNIPYYMA
jgi:hypothetical protein